MESLGLGCPEPDDARNRFDVLVSTDQNTEAAEDAIMQDDPATEPDESTTTGEHTSEPDTDTGQSTTPRHAKPTSTVDLLAELSEHDIPPELRDPDEPDFTPRRSLLWSANAFPHLIWLSVIAGLTGQIYGWSTIFADAGPILSVVVASTLGGVFEFIMVASSSRGLVDLGRGRSWWQVSAFLAVGTACAFVAFVMIVNHFTGKLASAGIAAAIACAVGYVAHVVVHMAEAVDIRSRRKDYERELADKRARRAEYQDRRLAERDELSTEVHRARTKLVRATVTKTATTVMAPKPTPATPQPTPQPTAAEVSGEQTGAGATITPITAGGWKPQQWDIAVATAQQIRDEHGREMSKDELTVALREATGRGMKSTTLGKLRKAALDHIHIETTTETTATAVGED